MPDPRPYSAVAVTTFNNRISNLAPGKTGVANFNSTEIRALSAMVPHMLASHEAVFAGPGYVTAPVAQPVPVGTVLTAKPGPIRAKPAATPTYQWTRDGVDIATATNPTYTTVAGDAAKTVAVKVTATNASGATVSTLTGLRVA